MAVKTTQEPTEPDDPFDNFELAEQWAFIFKCQSASGLLSHFSDFDSDWGRELLRQNNLGDVYLWRELLIDKADELSLMGLAKVAAVCLSEAERRPSKFDRPNQWHASEEKRWRESMDRQRLKWEAERQKRLDRRNGARP
jgi:hypothetical protein